ncbi:MAG: STAS domain-containing protein [Rhodobacteraceae bacterium]|nr:STAS domain-containing protein [Paracoccaceae bacterium]
MELIPEDRGAARIITVRAARIDASVAIRFKDAVRQAAGDWQGPVVLDLSSVTFLDSSGLGALVGAMKLLGPDRPLELAGLTPNVERVLRLTRMDTVFTIHQGAVAAGGAAVRPADAI